VACPQFKPGLDGQVRHGVSQSRAKTLRPGQFLAGSQPVSLMERDPRGGGVQNGDRRVIFKIGVTRQHPGLEPLVCAPAPGNYSRYIIDFLK
jgi:hypothetical protein